MKFEEGLLYMQPFSYRCSSRTSLLLEFTICES